jgi:hypothetical protein
MGRASKKVEPLENTFVSKRGSVIINRILVAEMGFKEGDQFSVRKTKSGISLKQLD